MSKINTIKEYNLYDNQILTPNPEYIEIEIIIFIIIVLNVHH